MAARHSTTTVRLQALSLWLVLCSGALLVGCGQGGADEDGGPGGAGPRRTLTGEIAALRGASARAHAEIEAVSLVDTSVAAATTSFDGSYKLELAPGPYLIVVRPSGIEGVPPLITSGMVVVNEAQGQALPLLALSVSRGATRAVRQGAGGTVIGMPPIPMSGPAALGLGDNASGALLTGLLEECRARDGKLIDLDPKVLDAIHQQQQLSDQGRLANPIAVNPLSPDLTLEGHVTAGADGTPLVDLTLRDARTGEVVKHIVLRGDPADGDDIGKFLRGLGPGIAEQACRKPAATPTPPVVARTPSTTATPTTGATLRIAISGPGSLDYFVWSDSQRRICPPACEVPVSAFRSDVGLQRARNLPTDEEQGARMIAWGGACSGIDVLTEPRGGTCRPAVGSTDVAVSATFEDKPKLTFRVTGAQTTSSFYVTTSPAQSGVPPPGHRFECRMPNCEFSYFFLLGSEVRLEPDGTQALRRWGGACDGAKGADESGGLPGPCTVTLTADSVVTIQHSVPRCVSRSGGSIHCDFEPP